MQRRKGLSKWLERVLQRFAFILVNRLLSGEQGWSPLIWACFSGQYDVNHVTCMILCGFTKDFLLIQVVKLLLAHKADEDLMKTMPSPVKRSDDVDVSDSEETEESRQGVVSPLNWAALKVMWISGWMVVAPIFTPQFLVTGTYYSRLAASSTWIFIFRCG